MTDRHPYRTWLPVLVLSALVFAAASTAPAAPSRADADAPGRDRVDVNTASAEELVAVPGIGPALAKRIVAFREEHGRFDRVEDLLKVRGIGERSLEKLRPHVTASRGK